MAPSLLRLAAFLPYRLSFTSNAVSEMIASRYQARFGLSVPEWRLIAVIGEQKRITQQEICRITRMDKVTVSRAAMALTNRKLVERQDNPADKRSHLLLLSKAGAALYADIVPRAAAMERSVFACLSASERTQLMNLLGRIDGHVDELIRTGGLDEG